MLSILKFRSHEIPKRLPSHVQKMDGNDYYDYAFDYL